MPQANQYTFNHTELLKLMIREIGLHEGRWRLLVNFGFSAGNFGPNDKEIAPGSITVVNWIGIQKAEEDSPSALTVDAAEVNPAPSSSTGKRQPSSRSRRGAKASKS